MTSISPQGPVDLVEVAAEHPEGGPDALADRQFDPGFEAAVGPFEKTLGLDAS